MSFPEWKKAASALVIGLMLLFLFYTAVLDHVPAEEPFGTTELDPPSGEAVSFRQLSQTLPSDPKRLRGISFALSDVPADGYLQVKVFDGDYLIYGGRVDFSTAAAGEYTALYLNLPAPSDGPRYLTFEVMDTEDEAAVYVRDTDGDRPGVLSLSADGKEVPGKQLLCAFEYRTASSFRQKAAYILPRLLLLFLILGIILCFERILSLADRIFAGQTLVLFFEMAAGCFLAPYVYHDRRALILACMTGVSAAAGYFAPRAYRLTRKWCDRPGRGILFVLFCVYSGFALAVLWAFPVNMTALYLLHLYNSHALAEGKRMPAGRFVLIVLLLIWIPALITLYAFNPLISTVDTMTAVHDARNLSTASNDWIPALYSLSIRAGLNILDNVCVVAIEQLLFWSFVITKILLYAREKGVRDGILFFFALFVGWNPANVLLINTGWKDIPFACTLIWAIFNLVRITLDEKKYAGRLSFHLEFAISLACTYMLRKNGAAPFLGIVLLLLIFFRGYRMRYVSVCLSFLLIFLMEGPVFRAFGISTAPMYEDQRIYSAFAVDSVGMYLSEAEMNEKALNFVAQSTGKYNNNDYQPTYYNFWSLFHFDSRVSTGDFIALAGDAMIKNPVKYLKVSLARNDLLWDIFPGEGRIIKMNCRSEVGDPHWLELASKRKVNGMTRLLDSFYKKAGKSVIYEAVYYRCGLYSWLSLLALLLAVLAGRKKEALLIHIPLLLQIFGLWATSGYGGEFRFYWPQNTVCLVYLLTLPFLCRAKEQI